MYQASVPVFVRAFENLSTILDKSVAHAQAGGIAPSSLVEGRLAPDMLTLAGQVQRASDSAKGCAARLAGVEVPAFADDETTVEQLQARIARTVGFLQGIVASQVDGSEEREVVLKARDRELRFTGRDYLLGFALPNFFFHVVTAYDILRHLGMPIGKMDYLGQR
jgi:hypothetical protein